MMNLIYSQMKPNERAIRFQGNGQIFLDSTLLILFLKLILF